MHLSIFIFILFLLNYANKIAAICPVVYAHIAHYLHIYYTAGMKIYFTCSTAEFNKYKSTYFAIRQYLIEQGHTLTRDWLPHTEKNIIIGNIDTRNIKEIYRSCMTAIKEADMVIIDDTVSNFSTGHQITIALQEKKPTLVLWQGQKHRQFKKMFIHGIDSELLEIAEYNTNSLTNIISDFIQKYDSILERNRFHLVLNNLERNYLDWAQYTKNRSRTKIIKDALKQMIEEDMEYSMYISEQHKRM